MTNNKANNYILYARKSGESDERQVASIPDQMQDLLRIAEEEGLNIIHVFDEAKSAHKLGRPKFEEMIKLIEKGEIDGLLTWKLNRISRNPYDGGRIMQYLMDGRINHIRTYSQSYDKTSNMLMMAVELGMSVQYSIDLSQIIKARMRNKAERGWYPCGTLPFGYKHIPKDERGKGLIEIVPIDSEYQLMKNLYTKLLTAKYSLAQLHREALRHGLTSRGKKSLSKSNFYRMFRKEFYAGIFYWKDREGNRIAIEGRHKAVVTKEEFVRAQVILNKALRPQSNDLATQLYVGLFRCTDCTSSIVAEHKYRVTCTGCKKRFSARNQKQCKHCGMKIKEMDNPVTYDQVFYVCNGRKRGCKSPYIKEEELTSIIEEYLESVTLNSAFIEVLKKALVEASDYDQGLRTIVEEKQQLLTSTSTMKENVTDLLIDGTLSKPDAQERISRYTKDIQSLKNELMEIEYRHSSWKEEAFQTASNLLVCYQRFLGLKHHKDLVRGLLLKVGSSPQISLRDKEFNPESLHYALRKAQDEIASFSPRPEPKKMSTSKAGRLKKDSLFPKSPVVCSSVDQIRSAIIQKDVWK